MYNAATSVEEHLSCVGMTLGDAGCRPKCNQSFNARIKRTIVFPIIDIVEGALIECGTEV